MTNRICVHLLEAERSVMKSQTPSCDQGLCGMGNRKRFLAGRQQGGKVSRLWCILHSLGWNWRCHSSFWSTTIFPGHARWYDWSKGVQCQQSRLTWFGEQSSEPGLVGVASAVLSFRVHWIGMTILLDSRTDSGFSELSSGAYKVGGMMCHSLRNSLLA